MRPSRFAARALSSMLLALVGVFAAAGAASAETIIAGGNVINQTWTPAGSPYTIQGDITVPLGAFLNIQAGTIVQFNATDGMVAGADTARVELTVRGDFNATGSAASPVRFRATSGTTPGTWYGVVLDATATSASMSNVILEHSIHGVRSSLPGATFTDSTFQNNSPIWKALSDVFAVSMMAT